MRGRGVKRWIVGVLIACIVLLPRCGVGPVLVGVQIVTGAHAPGGNCGNEYVRLPNTDLISWGLSDGTAAAFEEACVTHDQCYNTLGQSKGACDRAFLLDMQAGCQEAYRTLDSSAWMAYTGRLGCGLQAETYFIGVWAVPLIHLAYCYEQYYAKTGSRDSFPDPITVIVECR